MICLLDLDGTLIDSTKRHWMLMEALLKEYCAECADAFAPTEYMEYKADGHSGKQYLTEILHLENAKASEVQGYWTKHIEEEQYLQLDALYEDALPFLQELKHRGYRIIYLTARQNTQGLHRELVRLNLAEYAEQVIIVDPSAAKEEKILATRALLASDPQVILIGDTENEQAVADAIGIPVYLLNRGFRSRKYWDTRQAASYDSLNEIF